MGEGDLGVLADLQRGEMEAEGLDLPDQLLQVPEGGTGGGRVVAQGGEAGEYAGGLGLGLAIVRNLIRHHDGRVWAESEGPGRGSSFHVELPLAEGPREGPGKVLAANTSANDERPVVRVMLVDDNADALSTMSWMLRLSGCEVLDVGSGAEALVLAPGFGPEVAVLDIGMPEMDGFMLARRLREDLGSATPHLIALTGFGQPSDRERAVEAGFDTFLVKPVEPPELEQAIRRLCAAKPEQGCRTAT